MLQTTVAMSYEYGYLHTHEKLLWPFKINSREEGPNSGYHFYFQSMFHNFAKLVEKKSHGKVPWYV